MSAEVSSVLVIDPRDFWHDYNSAFFRQSQQARVLQRTVAWKSRCIGGLFADVVPCDQFDG